MILPDVSKVEVDMARDYLYMFGDVEPFVKLLGVNLTKSALNDTAMDNIQSEIQKEISNTEIVPKESKVEGKVDEDSKNLNIEFISLK